MTPPERFRKADMPHYAGLRDGDLLPRRRSPWPFIIGGGFALGLTLFALLF